MNYKIIQGNQWHLDGGVMFGNAPKSLWSKWVECDEENRITMASNCLLIQHNDLTVLVDTGISPFMEPKLNERYAIEGEGNDLIKNLKENGVAEEDVDYMILTHLHFDHIGGLIPAWPAIEDPESQPFFPNAKYVTNKRQFERAHQPHPRDRASYFSNVLQKIEDTGRMILLDDGENIPELEGFISLEVSDGHTPGMLMPLVRLENETIFFPSDMISGTAWVHLPIVTGLDRAPEILINSKKEYLDKAIAENWLIVYEHDPVTPSSHVRFNEEKSCYAAAID